MACDCDFCRGEDKSDSEIKAYEVGRLAGLEEAKLTMQAAAHADEQLECEHPDVESGLITIECVDCGAIFPTPEGEELAEYLGDALAPVFGELGVVIEALAAQIEENESQTADILAGMGAEIEALRMRIEQGEESAADALDGLSAELDALSHHVRQIDNA